MADASPQEPSGDGQKVAAHTDANNNKPEDSQAALARAWRDAEHILPLDEVVRKEVWEGSIPIRLSLAPQDISTFDPPLPFYVQAPRMSYLPLALGPARAYFQSYAPSLNSAEREMWLDYKGTPLKWHLPTGVLFDLLATPEDLPWALTVHLSGYPEKQLLPYVGEGGVKSHFRQTLKQGACLRHGTSKRVNHLSVSQMEQMWTAIVSNDFVRFSEVGVEILKPGQGGQAGLAEIRRLPVRVLLPHLPSPIQHPFPPFKADGTLLTLQELLSTLLPTFPHIFPASPGAEGDAEGKGGGEEGAHGSVAVAVTQGIRPPLQTPVLWLCQQLAGCDGFLYVSVVPAPPDN